MEQKYCFNPKDPTVRFVMTEFLMDEGFVECPAPGTPIPPTLLAGAGGVLDQTAANLAKQLRAKMGNAPTEAQLKRLVDMVGRVDLDTLEAKQEPVSDIPPPPEPQSAMGATDEAAPPAEESNPTTDVMEMHEIPQVNPIETTEAAVKRWFKTDLSKVTKPELCNFGLKKFKVQVDMAKTKPMLVKDLQMAEAAARTAK